MDAPGLPEIDRAADVETAVVEVLDFHRAVLVRKCAGLSDEQLAVTLPFTDLTLGGLLLHMAVVEDVWFDQRFLGNPEREPWSRFPWDEDPDWEFHVAKDWSGEALLAQFSESVARSRATLAGVDSLDAPLAEARLDGVHPTIGWVLVHLVAEYARHCGHADFLRQYVDGKTGD